MGSIGGGRKPMNKNPNQEQPPAGMKYQVSITCTGRISMHDLHLQDNRSTKPLFVQMVNNKIK